MTETAGAETVSITELKPLGQLTSIDVDRIIEITGAQVAVHPRYESDKLQRLSLLHSGFVVAVSKGNWRHEDETGPFLEVFSNGATRLEALLRAPLVTITPGVVRFTVTESGDGNIADRSVQITRDEITCETLARKG